MKENKLVQEALIQMKQVEEAIAENAKGILQSTMKEEISQLVKESLNEQDDEVDLDADVETDADNDEMEMNVNMGSDETDDEDEESDDDMDMDIDMNSDESPIDLTDASDEEILKVFKAMSEDDGIIVKKDGENVHLSDDNANVEYLVKLGESEEDEMQESDMNYEEQDESVDDVIDAIFKDGSMSDVDSSDIDMEDDEVMYEITLDEDEEEMDEQDEEMDEQEEEMDEEWSEEMDEQDDEDMDDEDMDDEDMDDEEMDENWTNESYSPKKTKPKGVGIGSGPKFTYKNKAAGGFKEDKKQGPKTMGTGKAKFEYKKGANMEGKSKVVKSETKESAIEPKGKAKGVGMNLSPKKFEYKEGTKKGDTLKRKAFEKEETKEAARTYGMGSKEGRGLRKGITNNRNYVYDNGVKVESINQDEVRMLREKNEEYRKALNVFREKLNEVAIFNSNLAYATRLFTEHSTTKKEKINILRRFDNVESLKESKNLYKSIKDELGKVETKSINESVGTKINKTVSTGSSTTLIESKTYENPQFLRMKDLMGKLG
jgi:hypothetical protein